MIRILSLLLALMLAATSVTAAVMHSEMQGSRQIVICADTSDATGLSVVTLDATGKPLGPHHSCPACTAAAGYLPQPVAPPATPHSQRAAAFVPPTATTIVQPAPQPTATGPPAFA